MLLEKREGISSGENGAGLIGVVKLGMVLNEMNIHCTTCFWRV